MNPFIRFLKNWTLPIGMTCGVMGFMAFHYIPQLSPIKPEAQQTADILFQMLSCLAIAMFLHFLPSFSHALHAEGLMICLVCPKAGAAAVITGKLGGSETSLTTYTILSNLAAAIIIPLVFPMVENHTETSFLCQFLTILRRVFPLLIFPFLIAWGLRVFFPKAHAAVVRHTGGLAFYLWGFGLTLSVGQTCRYLVDSPVSTHLKWLLSLVSLVACAMQFFIGKTVGAAYGERIGGGQGLGQKNTIFAIWVSYTYLSPVLSVAPGTYIIWQNLFNSWQLWRKEKQSGKKPKRQ